MDPSPGSTLHTAMENSLGLASASTANQAPTPPVPPSGSPSVPAHIAARFLVDENRYHYRDRQLAFVDHGSRFTVATENRAVLKDLMDIAQARGWQAVQVGGTERFRREAWATAFAAGLTVKGYEPSPLEVQAAIRARDAREQGPVSSEESSPVPNPPSQNATHRATDDFEKPQDASPVAAAIRSAETTREELQLKYPDINRAVFKHLDAQEAFVEAFVRAGLIRDTDRAQVIARMRERLASSVEKGRALKTPDGQRVKELIARSVAQAQAVRGSPAQPPTPEIKPREVAREEIRVRG